MNATPAALDVLARAEKRLAPMIARRGIDAEVLAVAAMYERMYDTANTPAAAPPADDIAALADATRETTVPEVVSPELLANARAETKARMRRLVMDRWAAGVGQLPADAQGVTS